MIAENWDININYKRGDIVKLFGYYYVCCVEHLSDNLTSPSKEDIYWLRISQRFLNEMKRKPHSLSDIGTSSSFRRNNNNRNYRKYNRNENNHEERELITEISVETEEEKELKRKKESLKRKLQKEEVEIENFKKRKLNSDIDVNDIREQLLLLNVDVETKSFMIDKYDNVKKSSGTDYSKGINWLKIASSIPYGKIKNMKVDKNDTPEKIKEFFQNVKSKLDKEIYGLEDVKQEILEFVARKVTNPDGKGEVLALCGAAGTGKCFAKDTPILMYDGKIKVVQDIRIGDVLMGDDSTPRKVLCLGSGKDQMYTIRHKNGDSYTVNSEHILCVKFNSNKQINEDKKNQCFKITWLHDKELEIKTETFAYNKNNKKEIFLQAYDFYQKLNNDDIFYEIPVKDYLQLSDNVKTNLKGYYTSVKFFDKLYNLEPYLLGVWLGNENCKSESICFNNKLTKNYVSNLLKKTSSHLELRNSFNKTLNNDTDTDNRIYKDNEMYKIKGNCANYFTKVLQKYDLENTKNIPYLYKCNSTSSRLELLAGIIDNNKGLKITKSNEINLTFSTKQKKLVDDIIYVCKSLGFMTYLTKTGFIKREWNIKICYNNLFKIPSIMYSDAIDNTNLETVYENKDYSISDIEVIPRKIDDYYGFMIDGNEKFVLGNFIVTHNTKIIKSLSDALELPFYQINCGGLSDAAVLTGHSETYVGSKPGKIVEIFQNCEYMNPIIYLDEIDKISETKGNEINGILTHLLDEEQNNKFQDNYLSNIPLNLSKVLFVISFNDKSKVNDIVSDRMKIIYIDKPSLEDKIKICQDKILPDIIKSINLKNTHCIQVDREIIEYIITRKCQNETGMRRIKKTLEKILNRLNYDILIDNTNNLNVIKNENNIVWNVTMTYVDNIIKSNKDEDTSYLHMYL